MNKDAFKGLLLIALIIFIVKTYKYISERIKEEKSWRNALKAGAEYQRQKEILNNEEKIEINQEYKNAYEPKYLMTQNEKNQFKKIRDWAQPKGLIVLSKVRLLDLITPRNNQRNYKGLLWKIQAKHVDFVICDNYINIKCIVEILDSSHYRPDRTERDLFVKEILEACGYNVLMTHDATPDNLDRACGYNKEKETTST